MDASYYLVCFIILVTVSALAYRFADFLHLIDKPTGRSSHFNPTITGMGILFPLAFLIYLVYAGFPIYWPMYTGFFFISVVSLIDDIRFLKHSFRLIIQILAIGMMVSSLSFTGSLYDNLGLILAIVFFGVGVMNAFNFMDGINGMLGLNALVILGSYLYLNETVPDPTTNTPAHFTDNRLLIGLIMAVAVFLFYNLRKKALAFMGDVGAMSLSFIIFFMMCQLVLKTGNYLYLSLFSVLGIDAGLTVIYKLMRRENLFVPHRDFLFKKLVHIGKQPHVRISITYALIQLVINVYIVTRPFNMKLANQFATLFILVVAQVGGYIYYMNRFVRRKPVRAEED